ncbi:MAG TPA: fructosamine kinase family protein [Sphingomonas sp.]|nr:fructosamine kinase family protein [Sphingomonas sp.]
MSDLAAAVEAVLGVGVAGVRPLAGGDLSAVQRVTLADGRTIVAKQGARVAAEARMLGAIRERGVPAPAVLGVAGEVMLLERLPGSGGIGSAWDDLARVLGPLHRGDGGRYGWDEEYAFGPVAILNGWSNDWPSFWAERRLRCHLPHLPAALAGRVEALAGRIGELLPTRPAAALLHGDLWGGNVLADGARVSGLIDPACSYGDREVDVAMLTLFDAPLERFFDALELAPGWRERLPVYRLWPLLVHVRLFGGGYAGSAAAALEAVGF